VWSDNETDVDLLGFDVLVDELTVALTDKRLLPLTLGVLGGWGSGKSSLLKQAYRELAAGDDSSPYVCIEFSPWRYEDYEDVKSAFMRLALDACAARANGDADRVEEIGALRRFARAFGRRSRTVGSAAIAVAPAVAPGVLAAIDPHAAQSTVDMTSALVSAAAPAANRVLAPDASEEAATVADIEDVTEFHLRYAKLVDALPGVDAVIVFVDDLDRCLPETIVDTFEAIRLFLNAPKTAYVIAANRQIIEAAIDSRYRQLQMDGGRKVGHEYLEKMLQLQIVVPSLSAVETAAYVSLLVTELHLDESEFDSVCGIVKERRAEAPFAAVYNRSQADEILRDRLTPELAADLDWANDIGPVLAEGFDGNPRSIKRFLNDLRWRQRAGARRGITLRSDVLAKLMVLEERHTEDLQTVFDWQHRVDGPSPELARAQSLTQPAASPGNTEPHPSSPSATPSQPPTERSSRRRSSSTQSRSSGDPDVEPRGVASPDRVDTWVDRPEIRRWLQLPPDLSALDLRPYFTYFREHIVVGSPASTLRPALQALLTQLMSDVPAVSRAAIASYRGLPITDQDDVALALLDSVARRPDSAAFGTAGELAAQVTRLIPSVCEALGRIPHTSLSAMRVPGLIRRLPETPERAQLLAGWTESSVNAVRSAATAAGRPRAQSERPG